MKFLPYVILSAASFATVQSLVAQAPDAGSVTRTPAAPALPEQSVDIPTDEVYLDLPPAGQPVQSMNREAETISVDFPDEDVRNIIRNVAELYELNVVIPEELTGRVSLRLRNVTWRQVFDVILRPLDYTYVIEDNIIMVKSFSDIEAEPTVTRVFVISFADATALKATIDPLVQTEAGGRMQVDQRNNALVVTERPSKMDEIQEIIDLLDRPNNQVMIESKFVEISGRDQKNIGIDWSGALGGSTGFTAGPFNRTYESEYERERGSTNESTSQSTNTINNGNFNYNTSDAQTSESVLGRTDTDTWSDTAVFSADAFRVVVGALQSNSGVELVSNPTVVTMNNQPAEILVGQEYPVVSTRFNPQTGTYEADEAEYKNIGIQMMVTPSVNSAGFITLNVEPEVSSLDGTVTQLSASYPIISTRRTRSVVTIKDGYTLALGGLIERREQDGNTRVPVLGKVPVLGRLFRNDTGDSERRNLVIFITAKVLSASGATYRDVFSQRRLWEMGINQRDLPGYQPPAAEDALFDSIQERAETLERMDAETRLQKQLEELSEQERKLQEKAAADSSSELEREVPRRNQP
ncbi:MAG: secretin N-terminal domain-containing protein [Verrucomicrobiota bacterium JB022]|nr:secretin N-terminal domain-containing protein [Verrucomicrobiota bacterium JB022]